MQFDESLNSFSSKGLPPQSSYEADATLTEFELKKILIDKIDKSKSYLAALEHRKCYEGLIQSYDLDKSLFSTYGKVYSLKRSRKDKDKDEDPSAGSDRGLKKRKTSKDAESAKGPKAKESQSGSSKGDKSQPKSSGKSAQSEEPDFEVGDSDIPQDQEENMGNDNEEPKEKRPGSTSQRHTFKIRLIEEYDFEECYKALSKKLDWENPEGDDYPFDLTKPLPLLMSRNHQKVPVDYFFNNDLKYLQGGISTMTYTTSLRKTKAAQYDLQGIEYMVLNIWVEVMRKHGYGYLKEIVVRRAGNELYRFKEGNFPHLRINDIEDMILLVVQNRLTNLSGHDKKINVTRPQTTISGIRKRDPYTPYQDPQRFIYVDNNKRNRLMRSDELYKFSDRTLTELRTSLDDITKNIRMEYLPKRCWSTLENKRANIMIKAIDKQLKERRLIRSLEKFAGGRHYGMTSGYFNEQYDFIEILLEPTSNKLLVDAPVIRTASAAAKPCQGDSLEFYLITGSIYTEKRGTVVATTYEYVVPEVTRSQEGKRSQDDEKRLCLVNDLKEVLNHIIKSKPKVNDYYINSQVKD
ncbi:hypothetical protein Tco_0590090 [Tanacetum coccineum]